MADGAHGCLPPNSCGMRAGWACCLSRKRVSAASKYLEVALVGGTKMHALARGTGG